MENTVNYVGTIVLFFALETPPETCKTIYARNSTVSSPLGIIVASGVVKRIANLHRFAHAHVELETTYAASTNGKIDR